MFGRPKMKQCSQTSQQPVFWPTCDLSKKAVVKGAKPICENGKHARFKFICILTPEECIYVTITFLYLNLTYLNEDTFHYSMFLSCDGEPQKSR